MARILSKRHPNLLISDLGVRFVDGVLDTTDERVINRARALSKLGVVVEGNSGPAPSNDAPSSLDVADAPKGNASRDVWADYADSLGVTYAGDAKRDDIRQAVEDFQSESEDTEDDDAADEESDN